jgi:hypothetical protein
VSISNPEDMNDPEDPNKAGDLLTEESANSKMKCISWKAWHRKAYQLKSDVYNNKSGQTNELLSS